MELKKIQISNFRSIRWMQINIEKINNKRCLILLGKNEAGKSNILKAISAVFGRYDVSEKNQRKEKSGENISDKDYFICAIFELSQEDFSEIYNIFLEEYKNTELISFQNGTNIKDFIAEVFYSVVIRIDIFSNEKPWMGYWIYEKEMHFNQNIILQGNDFLENDNDEKQSFTINNLISILFEIIRKKWNLLSLYQCEKWEYKESFLLPNKVEIEVFKNNPDSCVPLKKLFFLGGKTNIAKAIDDAYKRDEGLVNLLDNISKEATEAFKKAWRDLGNVGFSLAKDGDSIVIHIQDELKFPMEDRSDGFKHFVSMLLAFSADNGDNDCQKILLIDEPDTHLYPISVKSLRDELLKIAQKHLVIYSTHSPYMIDDMAIGENSRHLIIEKKDGITSLCEPDRKPNYIEDELLLRAIGCSIFERVKNKNILFEGYNDFCLFMKFRKDSALKDYGAIYLTGIGDVKNIVPMIMLTGTKFCVVADSDNTSKSHRKNFEKNFPDCIDYWLEYDEYKQQYITLEDFFRQDFIKQIMLETYSNVEFDAKKSAIKNIEHIVKKNYDSKDQQEEQIRFIKNKLVDRAEEKNLQGYMGFLKKLAEKMKSL